MISPRSAPVKSKAPPIRARLFSLFTGLVALAEALGAGDLYEGKTKHTGYRKLCTLAHEFTHMHKDGADEIAKQAYLFFEKIPVQENRLTLPVAENILVFAATAIVE